MKVTLRKKPLKHGRKSLYLDIYHEGEREYEFLDLHLAKPDTSAKRQQNKETMRLAEKIRSQRHLELQSNAYGFTPDFKKKTPFLKYFKMLTQKRKETGTNFDTWHSTLRKLQEYMDNKKMPIGKISVEWLECSLPLNYTKKESRNNIYSYRSFGGKLYSFCGF